MFLVLEFYLEIWAVRVTRIVIWEMFLNFLIRVCSALSRIFQQAICVRSFRTFIISLRTLIFSFLNQNICFGFKTYVLGFIEEVLRILTTQNMLKMMD